MAAAKPLPSQEYLRSLFVDEGDTVSWKVHKANAVPVGTKALAVSNGYYTVTVDRRRMLVHRVLFKMRHGYEPDRIDHIDGNTLNNRHDNLRPATHSQNMWNSGATKSATGVRHVGLDKRTGRFTVRIRRDGKTYSGGDFATIEEARDAADKLRKMLHGEFAYGNVAEARKHIPPAPEYEADTALDRAFIAYVDTGVGWKSFSALTANEQSVFEKAFKEGCRFSTLNGAKP